MPLVYDIDEAIGRVRALTGIELVGIRYEAYDINIKENKAISSLV